jgi:two-component system response regulator FixJ
MIPQAESPGPAAETIYIVDDDASFLRSLGRLLKAAGYRVAGFSSAKELLINLGTGAGCVVADLQMPGIGGLELQETLRRSRNPLPVVFLTGQGDIPSTVRAMRGGAEDFLMKMAGKQEILKAVERALARGRAELREREDRLHWRKRFELLSDRELEVLREVVRGKPNKQIADKLGVTERTVKLHRTSLTRKLNVYSVAELTRLVSDSGLFQDAAEM